jgi:hypothetical protein
MTKRNSPGGLSFFTNVPGPIPGGELSVTMNSCLAAGTWLAVEDGEQAVEDLQVGDRVRTVTGELAAVEFLGHRRVDCRRHPRPAEVWPVRVMAGAFGIGRPRHDLYLSPNQAILAQGVLVPVRCLIDHDLIVQEPAAVVSWVRVGLATNEIVLAEGLPVEALISPTAPRDFDNGGNLLSLHPDFWSVAREVDRSAPLVASGRRLMAIRRALRRRAAHAA